MLLSAFFHQIGSICNAKPLCWLLNVMTLLKMLGYFPPSGGSKRDEPNPLGCNIINPVLFKLIVG